MEKKINQDGNKVSSFEIVNEVDEDTVTKENNILLTREPTTSLLSGNVEYLDEVDTSLMIEADIERHQVVVKHI